MAAQAPVLDGSFAPQPNGPVLSLAFQADGKLLVGGSFSRIANVTRNNLVRIEVTGAADPGFNPSVGSGTVDAIAFQSSGKILVAGSFTTIGGQPRSRIARLNTNGTLDASFDAPITGNIVRAIVVLPDDRILIGGAFTSISNQPRFGLARLHANGSLDATFLGDVDDTPGPTSRTVSAIGRQPDGRIVFGGQFTSVNGHVRRGLARVSADGAIDAAFDPAGSSSPSITTLTVQRDGRILVGGSFFSLYGQVRSHIGRLNASGSLDTGFNPLATGPVFAIEEDVDGRLLVGGIFTSIAGTSRSYLARLEPSGAIDASFVLEGSGATVATGPGVQAIAISAARHVVVGGSFTAVAGATRANLARIVPAAPQIIVTASTVVATIGENSGLSFLLLGAPGTYQWLKDGVAIAGATSPNLTLNAVQPSTAGAYTLVATNPFGTASSSPITVIAGVRPTFSEQPENRAVLAGESVTFTAAASGTPTPGYQWRRNGVSIAGATQGTFTIPAVDASHLGEYTVIASSLAGGVTSSPAALSLLPAARLTNVSVRTTLASAQSLIVGFVVGRGNAEVLVRAAGPGLGQFGLSTAMTDPRMELFQDSTKLLENDNWPAALAATFARVGAFPFETNSRDAALLQTLTGSHSVVTSGPAPGVVLVEAYDAGVGQSGRLINVSARNLVGRNADILIAGFSVSGHGTMRVLIRAVGPTIGGAPFGVPGVLADPKLELFDTRGAPMTENDNWEPTLAATFTSAGAFALAPSSKDSAMIVVLTGGQNYTVQVKGADGGTGVALVEIFELP